MGRTRRQICQHDIAHVSRATNDFALPLQRLDGSIRKVEHRADAKPMSSKSFAVATAGLALALACATTVAIVFGGPDTPPPVRSINDPFRELDYSSLPPIDHFTSRTGTRLAYRAYPAHNGSTRHPVVLVHGSSASSASMHPLAAALAQAGYPSYALDVRGHGDSGPRGKIDYIGQLEDDLEDFLRSAGIVSQATLVGFSSGGGFALRLAGSPRQELFANYLLLSPFLHQDAPTFRPDSGGWVDIGVPRTVALTILNQIGITALNHLPIIRFALNDEARSFLTPQYSFSLAQNFRPGHDYGRDIRAANRPMELVAGASDEVFHADRFSEIFQAHGKAIPVTIVPDTNHIELTLEPAAIGAIIAALDRLGGSPAGAGSRTVPGSEQGPAR